MSFLKQKIKSQTKWYNWEILLWLQFATTVRPTKDPLICCMPSKMSRKLKTIVGCYSTYYELLRFVTFPHKFDESVIRQQLVYCVVKALLILNSGMLLCSVEFVDQYSAQYKAILSINQLIFKIYIFTFIHNCYAKASQRLSAKLTDWLKWLWSHLLFGLTIRSVIFNPTFSLIVHISA